MAKYKISVSKNQKKYSIVLDAISEVEARKKVHKEGYSILQVEEFESSSITGHKFYFEGKDKHGNVKKGKVVATDPFKVYVKLRQGLEYSIKFLYGEKKAHLSEGEKNDLVNHLEEQYQLYISHAKKNTEPSKKEETAKKKDGQRNLENFYMKKELEETYRLIDFVLIKLKNILEKADNDDLTPEKREKLKQLNNSIIKLKNTTNIHKLREVGELALKKVGAIELQVLEKYKDSHSKTLLKDTNSLLKKLGSKEQFVEKDKDIKYIMKKAVASFKETMVGLKSGKVFTAKKENIDKESLSYWKTEVLIKKYEERKVKNTKNILMNLHMFFIRNEKNKEAWSLFHIRRKVINQNITILKAKKTGKLVSYTKVVKGYYGVVNFLLSFLYRFNVYLLGLIFLFSLLFSVYIALFSHSIITTQIAGEGIFIFLYIIIASILIGATRGVLSLGFNLALFVFLFIFGVVNF